MAGRSPTVQAPILTESSGFLGRDDMIVTLSGGTPVGYLQMLFRVAVSGCRTCGVPAASRGSTMTVRPSVSMSTTGKGRS